MKILVDAHIGRLIIHLLERNGHEVLRASSFPPMTSDLSILRQAAIQGRVVMTSDKDFGELVFRLREPVGGVVLLRIKVKSEADRLAVVERFLPEIVRGVAGHFLVVTSKTVRRTPLPTVSGP